MTSTVGYGPLERVDGPPPIPPLYGLLPAAAAPAAGVRIVTDVSGTPLDGAVARALEGLDLPHPGEERWINGVEVYPYPPDLGDVHDPCAPGSIATTKGFGSALPRPQFGAMTVWLAETCTASKIWSQDDFKARALLALTAVESAAVARELLTGTRIPVNPHLADGNGEFPNGDAPTSVVNGLALLEDEIAETGRLGLIHCSPGLATLMRERFTVDNKTGVLRTINGNVIIPDAGYANAGVGPKGHAAGAANQEWMYATGPIDVRRSEMFTLPDTVEEAFDRGLGATSGRTNSITYRAERYYLADWDTVLQAAVLIDRCTSSTC
jgi:hypothetical protein